MRNLLLFLTLLALPSLGTACTIRLAVASNFKTTMEALVEAYEREPQDEFQIISGASGVLFSQILRGAPFDIFFSADTDKIERLDKQNRTYGESWTYAIGRMALYTPGRSPSSFLESNDPTDSIALANPRHAPYGAAGAFWLSTHLRSGKPVRYVFGGNVAQAFHYVQTGNTSAGLVALAQLINEEIRPEEYVALPVDEYPLIEQRAAVLNQPNCALTTKFVRFLHSDEAAQIIQRSGYETVDMKR